MTFLLPAAPLALPLLSCADVQRLEPAAWAPSPLAAPRPLDADKVRALWPRLHSRASAPPADAALLDGWVAYHNGAFAKAALAGERLGDAGLSLRNEATAMYANYVEQRETTRLALLRQVIGRTQVRLVTHPDDADALYWLAQALGRHAQAVSVARALAQGLGYQIKLALERLLVLQPEHANAHFALGAFHAEVIDKVGPLVGRMTYGVRAETAESLFTRGLALKPHSATGLMEYARALLALHGEARADEATRLYERAAAIEPVDAREHMDQVLARESLKD